MINIENLKEFAQPYYAKKDIMHNLCHIGRILKSVEKLLEHGEYNVDMEIVTCAAYFHGFIYNSEKDIVEWLKTQEVAEDKISKIINAAWEAQKDKVPVTLEGKVLHDAYMTEGEKTYLVVKSLIIGCSKKQTLEETIKYMEDNVLDKGSCYLPEAQEFYIEQQNYAKEFVHNLRDGLK
ncbi:hypothetical protein [Clostridium frigidicarnis]|uniref:HD domain-containing protein n=1 Tax=Clostridium frigidicarnis TaxID=84698 RepID=A0A1I0ZPB0_9CLOT|nr:hypothetical protein [Clostridium frigidicarnis]SFB26290.1 uncharacterized protein SAMN04488528_102252 [Clostridium frigidicarnis]